jgi:endonuclease G
MRAARFWRRSPPPLDPSRIFITDEKLDFTVIAVSDFSDRGRRIIDYPWMKLMADIGKTDVGDSVNIIQHPRGGLKQIAFRENKVIAIPQGQPQFLYYTTDTEPGSSGSPCFNDQWELVALHHSGVPEMDAQKNLLKKDHTVWTKEDDPALLNWIGNEGIRISVLVSFLSSANLGSQADDIVARALTVRPPNPIELARATAKPRPDSVSEVPSPVQSDFTKASRGAAMSQENSITWSIPLNVTISMGQAFARGLGTTEDAAGSTALVPASVSTAGGPSEEVVVIEKDYSKRPGYNSNFLGISVPLPSLSVSMQKDTATVLPEFQKHGDRFELAYYNYSIYMNKKRRTAWFSAANVDGSQRPNIGKRQGDKWFIDPRISTAEQLGQEAFESGIDRGHLTRREDTAWGTSIADALRSNNDTFHFTNCSLQASAFNRGKDRWQGLEQFLLERHAKKDKRRMVVVTGPVFAANDPVYAMRRWIIQCAARFSSEGVRSDPTRRYSIGNGFLLGQEDIRDLPGFEEAFDVAAIQVRISDLEKDWPDFGDLKDHDHFAGKVIPVL